MLYKDIMLTVRTSMAAGFKEIINLLDFEKFETDSDKEYFINVLNSYLKDKDSVICKKALPTICNVVQKFNNEKKMELLDSLIKPKIESIKQLQNGRDGLISMLEKLFEMF